MEKIWIRIFLFLLIIWAAAAFISAVSVNKQGATITEISAARPPVFHLVIDSLVKYPNPKIRSESAVVVDLTDGHVLVRKNESSVRSIASLTKLATALAFLATNPDLSRVVTICREDRVGAGRSRLYSKSVVTLNDVFHLMLISSDNVAARVIARSSGMTAEEFAGRMNAVALKQDLIQTHFVEPTGLDPGNVSTAAECSILLKVALDNPLLREIMAKKNYSFRPLNGKRVYAINNTNRMLFGRADILGGKTGYISESGYCLALCAEREGRKLAAVILGAPTSGTRFREAARILNGISVPQHVSIN